MELFISSWMYLSLALKGDFQNERWAAAKGNWRANGKRKIRNSKAKELTSNCCCKFISYLMLKEFETGSHTKIVSES